MTWPTAKFGSPKLTVVTPGRKCVAEPVIVTVSVEPCKPETDDTELICAAPCCTQKLSRIGAVDTCSLPVVTVSEWPHGEPVST